MKCTKYVVLALLTVATSAIAADKYWIGGSGDWDTATANWSLTSGGGGGLTWTNGDKAIIEGASGTITLTEDINISFLQVATNGYTITGNRLLFVPSGVISNSGAKSSFTINSGITGSPDVYITHDLSGRTYLTPTAFPMVLGVMYRLRDSYANCGGSVSGNTIESFDFGNVRNKVTFEGTGTWTIQGDSYVREWYLSGGDLIAEGVLVRSDFGGRLDGGTFHYNVAGAFAPAGYSFNGAKLDNSSGGAITTCTNNYSYSLSKDLYFIGSQGANSDLYLGSGAVSISGDRTITVSNAAATLTIGGSIGDAGVGYGLTKAGAGTLRLDGASTYLGETIITQGTLSVSQPYMSDNSAVRISAGAVLNLDYVGADDVIAIYTNGVEGPLGTWGALLSGADNETALITGTGLLNVPVPTVVEGIRWWDGGTTNIAAAGNAISEGGGGTWDTSIKNWDCGAGVVHTNWNNATNDLAILKGIAGTVTLAEDVTIGHLNIDTPEYTIQGSTLHFAPGGTITNYGNNNVTISSGITGSPDLTSYAGGHLNNAYLAPTSTSMTLGTVHRPGDANLHLAGTAQGNTIADIPKTSNTKTHKDGSSKWTILGDMWSGRLYINDGTLICNGRLWEDNVWTMSIQGGTLIANGTMEGYNGRLNFSSGTLGGTGEVACIVTVPTNGVLAPGFPTGTMTITNYGCTIDGALEINVVGSEFSSLAVDPSQSLTITNATLNVNVGASTPATDLIIATYGLGQLDGQFAATNGIDIWTVEYDYNGGKAIALIPPASGTVLIIR